MQRMRLGGPPGVKRPYLTLPETNDPQEQMAQALDHIATVLSVIDHNIEAIALALQTLAYKK
jgi:hypothetical protein